MRETMEIRLPEHVSPRGRVAIYVRDARTGKLLQRIRQRNTVTNAGGSLAAMRVANLWPYYIVALAAGQSPQQPQATDSALIDERYRGQLTSMVVAGRVMTCRKFVGSQEGNGFTFQEVALVTALVKNAAGDSIFNRAVHSPIAKDDTKTITYVCTVTF